MMKGRPWPSFLRWHRSVAKHSNFWIRSVFGLNDSVSLRQKLAIVSCGLLSFTGILVETSMNVTFPTLIQEMHVGIDTV